MLSAFAPAESKSSIALPGSSYLKLHPSLFRESISFLKGDFSVSMVCNSLDCSVFLLQELKPKPATKLVPNKIEEYVLAQDDIKEGKVWIVRVLVKSRLASSNGEARRLISQGAVKLGSKKLEDAYLELELEEINNKIIQKGKRYFRKIIIK